MFIKSILNKVGIPTDSAEFLISKVEIAHIIDGRVRVIYKDLKTDVALRNEIEKRLSAINEVTSFKINPVTGSLLINYDVKRALNNKFITKFVELAKAKYNKQKGI